jgi:murein DD-endopeptidase MepM/ murein hydrolase activator NlpD
MAKKLALICFVLWFSSFKNGKVSHAYPAKNIDTGKALITILPARPLVEKDIYGYYLNFDIAIRNQTTHVLDLSSMEMSVLDVAGKLVTRKFLNRNGQSPGIEVLGNTLVKPGETISIFNPFHTLTPDINIVSMKYGLFFDFADTQQQKDNNKQRLPTDYDLSAIKAFTPETYVARTEFHLPLKGKLIVWDGHDFYSHHRRFAAGIPDKQAKVISANSNRYAYDFMSVDLSGSMYHGTPFKKENWYVFGQAVYAPADGKVVEVQNSIPDNEYNGKTVKSPDQPVTADPLGMGNHVIIDHRNGEFSVMLHLEKGSVRLHKGDDVKMGDQVGNVGFSGDAIYPHLHYTVMNGAKEQVSEGVPNYFNEYKLFRGTVILPVKRSRIDSGDIVESDR